MRLASHLAPRSYSKQQNKAKKKKKKVQKHTTALLPNLGIVHVYANRLYEYTDSEILSLSKPIDQKPRVD
jgi:hypothetical protein